MMFTLAPFSPISGQVRFRCGDIEFMGVTFFGCRFG
jgi:hypothetical protein